MLEALTIAEMACKGEWAGKTDAEKRELIKGIDWLTAPEQYRAQLKPY